MALRRVQIASIQTVVPLRPSDRKSLRVEVANDVRAAVFARRFHVVVYYKKGSDDDSGWVTGGWMKETLGTALVDHPMLCGRLLRVTNHDQDRDDHREFMEIVSNDSGVRLYEARVSMSLADVLEMVDNEVEAELVVWEDIDQEHPQFSPLAYFQVTNFSCGGYSIGFSCSLLVMDPFTFTTFLKQWANIHNSILSKPEIPKLPTFYLPSLQSTTNPILETTPVPRQDKGVSVIFKARSSLTLSNLNYDVALCIEEVENKLGIKLDKEATFTLIVKQVSGEMKAETLSRQKQGVPENQEPKERIVCEDWDDVLHADDMVLHNGNQPASVSYWINSKVDQRMVIVITSLDKGKSATPSMFIVTLP